MMEDNMSQAYKMYLKSPMWADIKDKVYKRDRGTCRYCGINIAPWESNVHHLEYRCIYHQNDEGVDLKDLVLLCEDCHRIVTTDRKATKQRQIQIITNPPPFMVQEQKKLDVKRKAVDERYEKLKYWYKKFIDRWDSYEVTNGGECNFNQIECVREHYKMMGTPEQYIKILPIQDHYRIKKYRIILQLIQSGYKLESIINKTRISRNMVTKVYSDPGMAQEQIKLYEERGGD